MNMYKGTWLLCFDVLTSDWSDWNIWLFSYLYFARLGTFKLYVVICNVRAHNFEITLKKILEMCLESVIFDNSQLHI